MTSSGTAGIFFDMSTARRPVGSTIDDLLNVDPTARVDLISGTLVDKPEASSDHAATQTSLPLRLGERFQRPPGGSHPGGWWFFTELLIQLGQEGFRPDVCGYRRERMPQRPRVTIVKLVPRLDLRDPVAVERSPRSGREASELLSRRRSS
jgi:hypothetical protein